MPFYNSLKTDTAEGKRIAKRLLKLKESLEAQVPSKTINENLLLATWNIRDFDKPSFGRRSDEAIFYIAEIISKFDIVAIQEVYKDLEGLKRVCRILGGNWKYLVTDTTAGTRGNMERIAFLYDSQKVRLGGLVGELVLPPVKAMDGSKLAADQFWRTPYLCAFKSGWSRFMLCSVHMLWGKGGTTKTEPADRVKEIQNVAQFLKKRTEDPTSWSRNMILLGDFNIFSTKEDSVAFNELIDAGFEVPDKMKDFTTNAGRNKHYDQIAFQIQKDRLDWTQKSGVFDFFEHVFMLEDEELFMSNMGDKYAVNTKGNPRTETQKTSYYKKWRTHQMSDHLPLWVELKIDFSEQYIRRKLNGEV